MKKRVVIGLGNPGKEYEGTRHNIGFRVCDELAARGGARFAKAPFAAQTAEVRVKNAELTLVKPLTFMNLAGEILAPLRIEDPETALLVVVDDADLPVGRLRAKPEGSSGGHNGLKSIIEHFGHEQFARLRVGIGRTPGAPLKDHVLDAFAKDERPAVERAVRRASDAVTTWALSGIKVCMNQFNRKEEDEDIVEGN